YIKEPAELLKPGQLVKVQVLSADPKAKRIALSMKALEAPPAHTGRPSPPPRPEPRKPDLNAQLARLNDRFRSR
ncbi:MAG TPA: hypothetical protein DEH78_14095, partial [Solibacterales bacterium]|nr:hypothetical protein [Bryobacterales bacterium]